jgi:putative flippase GtrA
MADWDSKLAKIDKQLESLSDDQLIGKGGRVTTPTQTQDIERLKKETSTFGVFARLVLSVLLAIGIIFWPYASRCGIGLAAYLGAVTAVVASGVWSAVWTFRHRTGRVHTLSLLLILWGLVLAATEILPRTGYAIPTAQHPSAWSCT